MTERDRSRLARRRQFLQFLAGSPLLLARGIGARPSGLSDEGEELVRRLIESPSEALNVFDFEALARHRLPPAHYGYLASGTDGDETLRANRDGFDRYDIRVRRLVDVADVDMSIELFGQRWPTPIGLAPVSSQRAFHPQAELASARAGDGFLQILSNMSSTGIEDVAAARASPLWFQLYPTSAWRITRAMMDRAEQAGSPVLVVTVDRAAPRNMETYERWRALDTRDCEACHTPGNRLAGKPMFDGIEIGDPRKLRASGLTWEFVDRLKESTSMKIVLKGIVTREDAALCLQHGVDGIIVSNHGGRAEASGRSTIESLPEVVAAADGRIPVLIDGGFRRGTDIFKALAMGARAVCIGRPYAWGLACFGQDGVDAVLELLRAELQRVMMASGAPALSALGPDFIADTGSR